MGDSTVPPDHQRRIGVVNDNATLNVQYKQFLKINVLEITLEKTDANAELWDLD